MVAPPQRLLLLYIVLDLDECVPMLHNDEENKVSLVETSY